MDPQKFGDSYDFVKSVPRQLFLPRIASMKLLPTFRCTGCPGGSSHEIGELTTIVGRNSLQRIGEPDLRVPHAGHPSY